MQMTPTDPPTLRKKYEGFRRKVHYFVKYKA
jgi:hypothetical protein